jgi:phosphoglycolate phosphatase
VNAALKLIVFDFDGTLADTFGWLVEHFDAVAERHGFARLDRARLQEMRQWDAHRIMRHHRVPLWKLPAIGNTLRTLMRQDIGPSLLFPGAAETLHQLSQAGAVLALVTSNSLENAEKALGPAGAALFRYHACGTALFGKAAKLRSLLTASGIPAGQAMLIGDEIRDAQAAAQAGIAFGAVAWGYAGIDALRAQRPQELFLDMAQLQTRLLARLAGADR